MTEDIEAIHDEALEELKKVARQLDDGPFKVVAYAQIATTARLTIMSQTLERIHGLLAVSNGWVYSMANREFVNDVPAWLEHVADEHFSQEAPMLEGFFDRDLLPPPVVAVFVKPIVQDEDGVGQVEFTATSANGDKAQTTRVVPLRGQS